MSNDIPYYAYEESESADGEAFIDDGDLKELLIDYLGDKISEEDIEEILKAASDENLSEEEFDNLIDEFILKNKS